jgi:hypothetical protein
MATINFSNVAMARVLSQGIKKVNNHELSFRLYISRRYKLIIFPGYLDCILAEGTNSLYFPVI